MFINLEYQYTKFCRGLQLKFSRMIWRTDPFLYSRDARAHTNNIKWGR
ncbi:hypothetical protein pKMKP103_CDS0149 [Klebsiella phage pKMKP103]|nr:hypothetical protein pKMKP103_CDS0149 [Klebsiella phage pKMKP103]